MTDRAHIYAVPGERYALLRGSIGGWLRQRRIPASRTAIHNGWWKRQDHLSDVVAAMEEDGIRVVFSSLPAPRHVPPPFLPAVDEDERRSA